jgi:hypothetical protein
MKKLPAEMDVMKSEYVIYIYIYKMSIMKKLPAEMDVMKSEYACPN